MKTQTIIKKYVEKNCICETERAKIKNRITQRENQIKRLKNKLDRLGYVLWIDEIIQPIAEELIKKMPDRTFNILGPFGLNAETSIHFYKKGITDKDRFNGDNCKSITFRPRNLDLGEIVLVDYSKDTHRYPKGSIAEINGGNYDTIPMKETTDELFDWMCEQKTID